MSVGGCYVNTCLLFVGNYRMRRSLVEGCYYVRVAQYGCVRRGGGFKTFLV